MLGLGTCVRKCLLAITALPVVPQCDPDDTLHWPAASLPWPASERPWHISLTLSVAHGLTDRALWPWACVSMIAAKLASSRIRGSPPLPGLHWSHPGGHVIIRNTAANWHISECNTCYTHLLTTPLVCQTSQQVFDTSLISSSSDGIQSLP